MGDVLLPMLPPAELNELNAEPELEVPNAPNTEVCPKMLAEEVDTGVPPKMLPDDDIVADETLLNMLPVGVALAPELTPNDTGKLIGVVPLEVVAVENIPPTEAADTLLVEVPKLNEEVLGLSEVLTSEAAVADVLPKTLPGRVVGMFSELLLVEVVVVVPATVLDPDAAAPNMLNELPNKPPVVADVPPMVFPT